MCGLPTLVNSEVGGSWPQVRFARPEADIWLAFGTSAFVPKGRHMHSSNLQLYSTTSSASEISLSVTASPSVLAIFTWIASSNFISCTTGRSAAFTGAEFCQRIRPPVDTYR